MKNLLPLSTQQALRKLGFSEYELPILNFLFARRRGTTREISHATSIPFDGVHCILAGLRERKIVSCQSDGKDDIFELCSDSAFFDWIEREELRTREMYEEAKGELRTFLEEMRKQSWQPIVSYYEGVEGVSEIFEDFLQTNKFIRSWVDMPKLFEVLGERYVEYRKRKKEQNLFSHEILPKTKENIEFSKNAPKEARFVENLNLNGDIRIYGDKVSIITLENKKLVGFVFESPIMAKLMEAIFETSWKYLPRD